MNRRSFFLQSLTPVSSLSTRGRSQSGGRTLPGVETANLPPLGIITLNRLGFGPRPGDLDAFNALGGTDSDRFDAYLEQQLNPSSINDSELDAKLEELGTFRTIDKSLSTLWQDHVEAQPAWDERIRPLVEIERLTMTRALHSKRQLQEVMADFWHNHFNVFGLHYLVAPFFPYYDRDVIRPHVLGNFRELLGAVAKSPPMLYYLDGFSNKVAGPNENFARELYDLHTMGLEHYQGVRPQIGVATDPDGRPIGYVDDDVYETARCFTGWSVNEDIDHPTVEAGNFLYREEWHDRFQKHILGERLSADQAELVDGESVLDLLSNHPGTAKHICTKLIRRLITDSPPEELVESAALVFSEHEHSENQIAEVVAHIARSDAFKLTWGEKVKRPFDYVTSALRAMNTSFYIQPDDADSDEFMWHYAGGGQLLFQWPSPDGYPDYSIEWLSTASMALSWRVIKHMTGKTQNDNGVDFYCNLIDETPLSVETPTQLADFWLDRLFQYDLDAEYREKIVTFMTQHNEANTPLPFRENSINGNNYKDRIRTGVALMLQSPEFMLK